MSKHDLVQFLNKVEQLQMMVDSLKEFPSRKSKLQACSTHEEVVLLAREWGYKIDRRWGEY